MNTVIDDRQANNKLNLKQQLFVQYYIDHSSPTFGNGFQSYKKAYGTTNDAAAMACACRLLGKVMIQNAMTEEMAKMDMGVDVRIDKLAEILRGDHVTRKTVVNKDGSGCIIESTPSVGDIIRVVNVINRLEGLGS